MTHRRKQAWIIMYVSVDHIIGFMCLHRLAPIALRRYSRRLRLGIRRMSYHTTFVIYSLQNSFFASIALQRIILISTIVLSRKLGPLHGLPARKLHYSHTYMSFCAQLCPFQRRSHWLVERHRLMDGCEYDSQFSPEKKY